MLDDQFLRSFRKLMSTTPSDRLPRPRPSARRRLATDAAASMSDEVRRVLAVLLGKLSEPTMKAVLSEMEMAEGEVAADEPPRELPTDPALTHDDATERTARVGLNGLGMDRRTEGFSNAAMTAFEQRFPDSKKIRVG